MSSPYQPIPVPPPPGGATRLPPTMGETTIGRSIVISGELRAREDITVLGHVQGPLTCEDGAVVVEAGAAVDGDIVARDITVRGRVEGQLVATEIVDLRADSTVTGPVIARRFLLHEGATFQGRVEPQHLEAAIRVARFQQQKRDATS